MTYLHTYYVTKRKWTRILSHLVRFFQGSEYDHAGFGISDDGTKPIMIHEATLSGVVATPYQEFMDNHSYVVHEFKIPMPKEELKAVVAVISEHNGKKYSSASHPPRSFSIGPRLSLSRFYPPHPLGSAQLACRLSGTASSTFRVVCPRRSRCEWRR